ncbi:MAG TPA: type II secretion system F family protein [Candidatus Norongarragalinales archaeon]|nr:type II secretion system F family protein [Candidatus Norongarragalinales archaeon]
MDLDKAVREFAALHDFSQYFPNFNYPHLGEELRQAGLEANPREWFSFSIIISGILGIMGGLIQFILLGDMLAASAFIPGFCALTIGILLKYPAYLKRKRSEQLERELSLALGGIIIALQMQNPFEKIIDDLGDGGYGILSREFSKTSALIEKGGATIPEALWELAVSTDSIRVKRIISQLIFIYESGTDASSLQKQCDELMLIQKSKAREFSGKMALWSLLFIAISCIIPAFLSAYLIISSTFLSMTISTSDIYTAFIIVFPALDVLVLAYIKEKTPALLTY